MRLGEKALARPTVSFALLLSDLNDEGEQPAPDVIIGPFTTVLEADQWWDQHSTEERFNTIKSKIIQIMENPS